MMKDATSSLRNLLLIEQLPSSCRYDVIVACDLAKVGVRVRFPLSAPFQKVSGERSKHSSCFWVSLSGLVVKSVSHDNGIVEYGERSPAGPPVGSVSLNILAIRRKLLRPYVSIKIPE